MTIAGALHGVQPIIADRGILHRAKAGAAITGSHIHRFDGACSAGRRPAFYLKRGGRHVRQTLKAAQPSACGYGLRQGELPGCSGVRTLAAPRCAEGHMIGAGSQTVRAIHERLLMAELHAVSRT